LRFWAIRRLANHGAKGRPPKILVLFLTVFEIHGILFFFGAAVAAGNESKAGMEGLAPKVRASRGSTPVAESGQRVRLGEERIGA